MFNMIPNDMGEVAQKLAYLQSHGKPETTEHDILLETAKGGVQEMLDEALEGPYYNVRWSSEDKSLVITGALKEEIGTVIPRAGFSTFSEDFKNNEILFWRNVGKQIATLIHQE
ncbi:MAG TPA: hypothetical protein K8V00_12440 [Ligilactobacillus acidipiscis]|uniref:Uncharacterized protein n=1 Tax=Ligilactobacillus acidipiscis TaxID=89059 RepID=A0A921FAK7_9LACO|nr:hypothetical protein [Ligilactobacillus acidipiscis]